MYFLLRGKLLIFCKKGIKTFTPVKGEKVFLKPNMVLNFNGINFR